MFMGSIVLFMFMGVASRLRENALKKSLNGTPACRSLGRRQVKKPALFEPTIGGEFAGFSGMK